MLKTEERLFDEYKMVDNICRDMFSSQSGVSQYITEMEQRSFYGCSVVASWNDDYRRLKRAKWLRNQIAHESSATDCTDKDAAWLENFHSRLLNGQDPLALLKKSEQKRSIYTPKYESISKPSVSSNAYLENKKASSSKKPTVALIVFIEVLIIIAAVALIIMYH